MTSTQIPTEAYQLGSPKASFSSSGNFGKVLGLTALGLGITIVSLILLIFDVLGPLAFLALIIGVGMTLISGVRLVGMLLSGTQTVHLFDDGFSLTKGSETEVVRWDDVSTVLQDIYTYRVNFIPVIQRHTYTVNCNDGRTLKMTRAIKGIKDLGTVVQTQVAERQLPRAAEALKAGQTLNFGPIGITRQGLVKGSQVLPWNEVKAVRVANGQIIVRKAGKAFAWRNTPASKVPNLYLFLTIVDRTVGIK